MYADVDDVMLRSCEAAAVHFGAGDAVGVDDVAVSEDAIAAAAAFAAAAVCCCSSC